MRPPVVTAITMPLTYSIATGIGLGFITYAAGIIAGKARAVRRRRSWCSRAVVRDQPSVVAKASRAPS